MDEKAVLIDRPDPTWPYVTDDGMPVNHGLVDKDEWEALELAAHMAALAPKLKRFRGES